MDIYMGIYQGNVRHKNRRKKTDRRGPMAIYMGQACGPSMDMGCKAYIQA